MKDKYKLCILGNDIIIKLIYFRDLYFLYLVGVKIDYK